MNIEGRYKKYSYLQKIIWGDPKCYNIEPLPVVDADFWNMWVDMHPKRKDVRTKPQLNDGGRKSKRKTISQLEL